MRGRAWTRRGLLLAAAAAGGSGLAACTRADVTGGAAPSTVPGPTVTVEGAPPPPVTVTATPSPDPVPTLPERPEPYRNLPGEVQPQCKRDAVAFLEAVMTFDDLGRDEAALAERLAPTGHDPATARPLLGLLPERGPAALRLTYPQYGGLTPQLDRASVLAVGDLLVLDGAGEPARRPVGADVRLAREGDRWFVTSVVPAYPQPPLPPLPAPVRALLDDDRVELSGVAAADLRAGVVDESVCRGLLALAEGWRIRVHVFVSAHPVNVYPTLNPSAHSVGRAVDVTALDGVPVIDQDRSPWRAFMAAALDAGATNIGGPVELTPVDRYFTDRVHQDHVHLAFPAG
ncbi:hypothetical protein [Aquipuribacter nitratireducens]|uniref:Extensin-like C-terminal domain-containing protein n=1 Tax=Aquipuribacter nitratireducens TaxID=650104 RepID=A0ABW0GMV8_9MICO